jgi:hypothetical protein
MNSFLHIYIVPKEGVSRQDVEAKLSKGLDWIRYGENNYIVYTNSNTAKWKERLIDFVKPGGNLLVVRFDIGYRKGFMSNDFWKWIREKGV